MSAIYFHHLFNFKHSVFVKTKKRLLLSKQPSLNINYGYLITTDLVEVIPFEVIETM